MTVYFGKKQMIFSSRENFSCLKLRIVGYQLRHSIPGKVSTDKG